MLWHAGERAAGFGKPGEMACPVGAAGRIDDYLFWTDENSLVHVWDDRHGLYVGTLLEDLMRNPEPSPYTVWVELFNTRVWRHPQTGKVYLGAASDAIHVYEVLGTDQPLERFSGEFEVTGRRWPPPSATGKLASGRSRRCGAAHSPRRRSRRRSTASWTSSPQRRRRHSPCGRAQGTARLMYDAENLYAAFDVQDDSPWKNSGGDLTTLFKTGDCVDIWLGPSAGKRPPGAGRRPRADRAGRTVSRRRCCSSKRWPTDAKPVPFRSPSGEVVLDRVSPLAEARVAVVIDARGYRLEAAMPWKSLGHSPDARPSGTGPGHQLQRPGRPAQHGPPALGPQRRRHRLRPASEARFEPELWGEAVLER